MENDRSIDLNNILRSIRRHGRLFLLVLSITLVVSAVVTLLMPRKYSCTKKMAIEQVDMMKGLMFQKVLYTFGFKLTPHRNEDVIGIWLYADLFKSTWWVTDILNMQIKLPSGDKQSYYAYMSGKDVSTDSLDCFRLTEEQTDILEKAKKNIACFVDLKTYMIRVTVTDKDPYVCAQLTDSVSEKLMTFIVDKRIQKAANNAYYYGVGADSAKAEYISSIGEYNSFADSHRRSLLQRDLSRIEMLEDRMLACENTYNALNVRTQLAEAIVQEQTPAFTVLQKSTVPTDPTSPRSLLIVLGSLAMVFAFLVFYVIKDDLWYQLTN